ncbi:MAG: CHAT domain-containing protein [Longimicrobiales bacterium]
MASPQQQSASAELVTLARERPDSVRTALTATFALASAATTVHMRAVHLAAARDLARAYAQAWSDPFLLRQAARFQSWSPAQRALKVAADSLRRAGNTAYGQQGVPTALRLWRASLHRANTLGDSAGRAAALGSLGAGFYSAGVLDSATVYLTRSRNLATRIGDHRTAGNAVGNLANVSKDRGDLTQAAEHYARAATIRALSGDTRGSAADQNNLGLIGLQLGDLVQAKRSFERALALNRSGSHMLPAAKNLTNLADIASIMGDYARAAALYREALDINRSAGDRAETAFVLHSLGSLEIRRGEYQKAGPFLSEAQRIHEQSGAQLEAVAVRRELALLRAATGELDVALVTLRAADSAAVAASASSALLADLALTRADLSVQLGLFADAENAYARAETLFRKAGEDAGKTQAQEGRALLYHLRDDHDRALRTLALAARGQALAGDRRAAALTQILVGHVQRAKGDTAAARQTIMGARSSLQQLADAVGEATAYHALGELAYQRNAPLAAEASYRAGLARLGGRPAADLRWRLHAGLGQALRSRGALSTAAQELRSAIVAVESIASSLRLEDRRTAYLADKSEIYSGLALIEQERGRLNEAFSASEQLRSRQMRDLLARGRFDGSQVSTAREQDLRRSISELMRVVGAAEQGEQVVRDPALTGLRAGTAREALNSSQKEYANLLLDLRETNPNYARVVTGEIVSWTVVAARLQRDEALLEFLVTDSSASVFIVTHDTIHVLDLDMDRRTLSDLIDFSRRTMERKDAVSTRALWRTPARRLYDHLIRPIDNAGYLEGIRRLIIVPHGELHFLSFGALLSAGPPERFLVERFQLSYSPSATVWVQAGRRNKPRGATGVLALAPRVASLPASSDELSAIRKIYGRKSTVLMGAAASERALRARAPQSSIIHLATYGVVNKHNPLFSFVELAPEGDDDGRLEVHEVTGLDLSGRLVVLSACQTALGSGALADVPPGDDWVGLVQGFFQAGATRILASLWAVEDRATAQLMEQFYRRLRSGDSEEAALAVAQRAALRNPKTAHPFYWAGFVLNGTRLSK